MNETIYVMEPRAADTRFAFSGHLYWRAIICGIFVTLAIGLTLTLLVGGLCGLWSLALSHL